jgi:hypothetical protein
MNYGGYDIESRLDHDDIAYSFPMPYTSLPPTPAERTARIAAIDQDARRASLPEVAVETLFNERQALLAAEGAQ